MFDTELNPLGFLEERLPDKEDLREQINMFDLLTYLGMEWNPLHDKVRCPFHSGGRERTPSLQVHDKVAYCFGGCKRTWDVYQFVMDYMQMEFMDALRWLADNMAELPKSEKRETRPRVEYKGPAPIELVNFYRSCLKEEQRQWLREQRLLTDETIDATGIGWRPDWKAYTFPYWRGKPFESQVDILQFRSTPDSPEFHGENWHYTGLKGHNRPSVINTHRAAYHMAIIVFGTCDSYLGCQDGLAMLSINGIAVMLRDPEGLDRLAAVLEHTQQVYIVPDNQANESESAYTLARLLNDRLGEGRVQVRHFPKSAPGKDYTECRQNGWTEWDFLREVIMPKKKIYTGTAWDSPFLNDEGKREWVTGVLKYMAEGEWEKAETYIECLRTAPCSPMILNHALQMKAGFAPFDGMSKEQWEQFREELVVIGVNSRYEDLFRIVKKYTDEVYSNNGGF